MTALDYDENVRKRVVEVICDLAAHSPDVVPAETIKVEADRLRDKLVGHMQCVLSVDFLEE